MNAYDVLLAFGIALSIAAILHLCRHGLRHLPLHALVLLLIPATAEAGWPCRTCYQQPAPVVTHVTKYVPQTSTVSTANNTLAITNYFQYAQPSAAQGSTLYGSLSDPYTLDLGALLTLHNRTIAQGIDGMTGLAQQYGSILELEGANRARVAEIRATGEAGERVANAVKAAAQRSSVTLQGQFNSGGGQQQTQTSSNGSDTLVTFGDASLVGQKCSRCHSPTGGTADADAIAALRTDTGINDRDRIRAIRSLLTDDVAHRMPKGETLDAQTIGNMIQELSRQ